MYPSRPLLAAAAFCAASALAQTHQTLLATPTTVAWGYYSATAKPVLTVHSGDIVIMQTASTCGPPARLKSQSVADANIPAWLGDLYDKVPQTERGPGGHILTGPVAIAEAEPGDVLEVRILKVRLDTDWACNGFGKAAASYRTTIPTARARSSRSTARK